MATEDIDLSRLSEDERSALEYDEQNDQEVTDDDPAAEEPQPDQDGQSLQGEDAGGEGAAGDQQEEEGADDAPESSEQSESAFGARPFVPQYRADTPEGAAQLHEQVTQRLRDLRRQFHDGEIDLEEYEQQREQVDEYRLGLRAQQLKAEIAQEHSQQALLAYWNSAKQDFLSRPENAVYRSDLGAAAFDRAVQELARKEENADRDAGFFLQTADRMVRESFGLSRQDAERAGGRRAGSGRRKALDNLPPNIGDAPSAELPETGGGEFAHLDKLGGIELERALAKMSEEQQMRYLTGE